MAEKTLLRQTGDLRSTIVTDTADADRCTFVTEQDLNATFKSIAMKKEQKHDKDFKPVAEIPAIVVEQMMRDGTFNDPDALKHWLNNPDNKCFRIWPGRV